MDEEIKEITDRDMIGAVVFNLFTKLPVSMIYLDEQIPVTVIKASRDGLVIKSAGRLDSEIRVLTFTNNGQLYHFNFQLVSDPGKEIEFLEPVKLIIKKPTKRAAERKVLSSEEKTSSFVENFCLESSILSLPEKIVLQENEWIKAAEQKLSLKYKYVEFAIHGDSTDVRKRILMVARKPVMFGGGNPIPSISAEVEEYSRILDQDLKSQFSSPELLLPLVYKNKVPVGYLSIKSDSGFNSSDWIEANTLTAELHKIISEINTFSETKGRGEILDISTHGIGFYFPSISFSPSFEPTLFDSVKALIDIQLAGLRGNFLVMVRAVAPHEDGYRFSAEFFGNSPEERIFLENFTGR